MLYLSSLFTRVSFLPRGLVRSYFIAIFMQGGDSLSVVIEHLVQISIKLISS